MQNQSTTMRNILNALLGVFVILGILAAQSVKADETFTNSSLQGNYAYANNIDGVGSLGPITFDGDGGLTATLKINLPCDHPVANCHRKIVDTRGTGTYTIKPNGTGIAKINLSVGTTTYDFVVSESTRKAGKLLATQLFAVSQTGGLAGQLVAPTWSRVSD